MVRLCTLRSLPQQAEQGVKQAQPRRIRLVAALPDKDGRPEPSDGDAFKQACKRGKVQKTTVMGTFGRRPVMLEAERRKDAGDGVP